MIYILLLHEILYYIDTEIEKTRHMVKSERFLYLRTKYTTILQSEL